MSLAAIRALSRGEVEGHPLDVLAPAGYQCGTTPGHQRDDRSRENRIAALLGELDLEKQTGAPAASETEAPVLTDADRSRVPTADASAIVDLASSLDVFLYAEKMSQSKEDTVRLGEIVAQAESRLPSHVPQSARSDMGVPSAAACAPTPAHAPLQAYPLPHQTMKQHMQKPLPARQLSRPRLQPQSQPAQQQPPRAIPEHCPAQRITAAAATAAPAARSGRHGSSAGNVAGGAARVPPAAPPPPPEDLTASVALAAEEQRLEASLMRLDSALEATRLYGAGASRDGSSRGGTHSSGLLAHPCSARGGSAPAASGGSRLAGRLRMAAAAAAFTGLSDVPCKAHGLVPCKLCADAARRPPRSSSQQQQQVKRAPPRPPLPPAKPPARRCRSAGPTSYSALRVAREVHAARNGSRPSSAVLLERPRLVGLHAPPQPPQQPPQPPVLQQPPPPPQYQVPTQPMPSLLPPQQMLPMLPLAHQPLTAEQQHYLMAYQQHVHGFHAQSMQPPMAPTTQPPARPPSQQQRDGSGDCGPQDAPRSEPHPQAQGHEGRIHLHAGGVEQFFQ